jgi:anti-sigma factor RsiW
MCDTQTKLLAWLDSELPPEEAADVERHVEDCQECRSRLGAYQQVSETFELYCDAVLAAKTHKTFSFWVPALAVAMVATAVYLLAFPSLRVTTPSIAAPVRTSASVPEPAPSTPQPVRDMTTHKRRRVPPAERKPRSWQPTETAVEIAIPAEAVLPPGTVPEGMNFIAELSIAPDGSVKQVRLRQ